MHFTSRKKVGRKVGRNCNKSAVNFGSACPHFVFLAGLFHPATAGVDC